MVIWTIIVLGILLLIITYTPAKWLLFKVLTGTERQHKILSGKNTRKQLNKQTAAIAIEWVEELDEDFLFTLKWVYDESTMRYLAKQDSLAVMVSADELSGKWVDQENEMREKYQNITHFPYTLQVNNEFNFINVEEIKKNNIECQSGILLLSDGLQYGCLNLVITDKVCYPIVGMEEIPSRQFLGKHNVTPSKFQSVSPCVEGWIKIDKPMLERALLKASFKFTFTDPKSHNIKYTLTGKICSPVRWMNVESPVILAEEKDQYQYMICLDSKYR